MIEASRFDPAVAYVAVDRHRLDDHTPYIYRTRDYGKTWQPIAAGIGAQSFVNAIREDTKQKGLLFAGTELGIYVSFDDGDHWQPLQLNLPVTSVRDITIHGDDLIVATHGRSFWILDDITPLRQIASQPQGRECPALSAGDGDSHRQRCLPRLAASAGGAYGEEPARRRRARLLPEVAGEAGDARNLRSQREVSSPLCRAARSHRPILRCPLPSAGCLSLPCWRTPPACIGLFGTSGGAAPEAPTRSRKMKASERRAARVSRQVSTKLNLQLTVITSRKT